MSVTRGTNIITKDLMFGYDTGYGVSSLKKSTRFYPGRPATNTIKTGATWHGDGGNQSIGNKGFTVITDNNLKYEGYETVLWTPGTSRNVYFNGNDDISTSDNSTVWTFSCYMRYEDQTPITSMGVYLYFPNSDGNAAGTITDCGNGWYRVSRTRTGSNNYISLAGFTTFQANKKIYLSGPMLTKTETEVPYIGRSLTRSNTSALLDFAWLRSANIDLTNVSFNSTGQPNFDGTDDYFTTSGLENYGSSKLTFDCVIKFNGTLDSNDRKVFHWDKTGSTNAVAQIRKGTNKGTLMYQHHNSQWYTLSVDNVVTANEYIHITVVHNGTTATMYKNGVQVGTTTVGGLNYSNAAEILVGYRANAEYWKGEIPVFKVYSRSLSASEVLQNFNAYKNRFNI